jgi:hypothetical protein
MGMCVPDPGVFLGAPREYKYIYRDKFLWCPRIVEGKLKWLTTVKKKVARAAWFENAGLGSYAIYQETDLGYCTEEGAFVDAI